MAIQKIFTIHCQGCSVSIPLPRQSHLGRFGDDINPSKDIWPINFLCLRCGHLSETPLESIHQEYTETQNEYEFVRYDFASDQSGSLQHCAIYTQEAEFDIAYRALRQQDAHEAIERVLKVSKIWDESHGDQINVSIDRGLQHLVPKTA